MKSYRNSPIVIAPIARKLLLLKMKAKKEIAQTVEQKIRNVHVESGRNILVLSQMPWKEHHRITCPRMDKKLTSQITQCR